MKNGRRIILFSLLFIVLSSAALILFYKYTQNDSKLNISEKKYITDNSSKLLTINSISDANIFGKDGKGVYFDFLKDFEKEYNLNLNIVTISSNADASGISLKKGNILPNDSVKFYTDHYSLVSKNHKNIKNKNEITGNIGCLENDKELISNYISSLNVNIKEFKDANSMNEDLKAGNVDYLIVPTLEYEDQILENLFSISYHFTDLKDYYYISFDDNDKTLSSIMKKFFNTWRDENLDKAINENMLDMFLTKLKITEKDMDLINRRNFVYGFVQNPPYDSYANKTFGGITYKYLKSFEDFSGLKIKKQKYNSFRGLKKATINGKVNIYVNYYDLKSTFPALDSTNNINASVVMRNDDDRSFESLDALKNEEIYAERNTLLAEYLNNNGFKVITYKNEKSLKKLFKEKNIVVMDKMSYLNYKSFKKNSLIQERFNENINEYYKFYSNNDTSFNKLLGFYIDTIDVNDMNYTGLENSTSTIKKGNVILKIIKYAVVILLIGSAAMYFFYKYSKKIFVRKKIKKSDKMKYIDVLTSVKNRNFLNDNISVWNRNTVYPQAIIVIDLNNIRKINDTFGYEEGDKQIQAAANILIKTQLDNTEIMRTDGNEFMLYMVSYDEKKVISYIKKLNKELDSLPHDYSASIGFSMILDDSKLVTDAINEATLKMKENKKLFETDNEKKI